MHVSVAGAASRGTAGLGVDPTFGHNGTVTVAFGPGEASQATSLAVETSGTVLIGASVQSAEAPAIGAVARLLPNGALDTTFGGSGDLVLPELGPVTEVEPGPNGTILLSDGQSLIRLTASGQLDSTFGVGGSAALPAGFALARFAVEADGSVALIGTLPGAQAPGDPSGPSGPTSPSGASGPASLPPVAVAHLTAGGQPDTGFGSGGVAVLEQSTMMPAHSKYFAGPGGVAIASDGSIVATLRTSVPEQDAAGMTFFPASLVERVTPTGSIDTTFGQGGEVLINGIGETVGTFAPLLDADGSIRVAIQVGTAIQGPQVWQVSGDGRSTTPPPDLITEFEPAGNFIAMPNGGSVVLNAYYNILDSFGAPNLSYFNPNQTTTPPNPLLGYTVPFTLPTGATDPNALIAAQSDGKLVAAGQVVAAGEQQLFVARLFGLSRVYIGVPTQRVTRTARSVRVRLSCTPAETCLGTAALTLGRGRHRVALGSVRFDVTGSRLVTIELSRTGRAYLDGRQATRATLTLTPLNGPTRTSLITVRAQR